MIYYNEKLKDKKKLFRMGRASIMLLCISLPFLSMTSQVQAEEQPNQSPQNTLAAPADNIISIPDSFLKQAIVSTLGLAAGSDVTQSDMARLTALTLNSAQISSFEGLEYAVNLSYIYMNVDNNVTDFSPLAQLSSLTMVYLQTSSLTSSNFPDLSKSTGLTNLSLAGTSIDDNVLPKLAKLTSLTSLNLDSNMNITTFAPLKTLPNLKSLNVQFCGITDFTVINQFPVLNNLAAFGQNTGRNDLPTTTGRSSLDYNSDNQTLFLPLSMKPNRMINFDGYIPPFTTSNTASNTYLDFNGVQLPADRLQIDEQGITVLGVTEDEFKNITSFEYNARINNPAGTYATPDGYIFYAISSGTYLHQFKVAEDGQPVTVHYQDENGEKISGVADKTISGYAGEAYDTTTSEYKIEIPGYHIDENRIPDNALGVFTAQAQTVTYTYIKDKKATIAAHDSILYVGDSWKPADNFDGATDEDGNAVTFEQNMTDDKVDTSKAGIYPVNYSYHGATTTINVTVLEKAPEDSESADNQKPKEKEGKNKTSSNKNKEKSNPNVKKKTLPRTGEKSEKTLFITGITFIFGSLIYLKIRKD
ncbi:MAG: bacterial Ig-like domain-containing protein [Streptococcaceae bacterium]|nr:bacterial Ig-like domain-containing protein [Streptococcaceae bacterium]